MAVNQEKSWNPATQKYEYIVYNEYKPSDQSFVKNFVAVGQNNWHKNEVTKGGFVMPSKDDLWTVTSVSDEGNWVELTNNISQAKLILSASELDKWNRTRY